METPSTACKCGSGTFEVVPVGKIFTVTFKDDGTSHIEEDNDEHGYTIHCRGCGLQISAAGCFEDAHVSVDIYEMIEQTLQDFFNSR